MPKRVGEQGLARPPVFSRRRFLKLTGAAIAGMGVYRPPALALSTYRVGLAHEFDPYAATLAAVEASGEWPSGQMAGRTVVIKPNLVMPSGPELAETTDPEVVRALVDMALGADAAQVLIVEGGMFGANFEACGYQFFEEYDPQGRVALVDLGEEPVTFARVPDGMVYRRLYMPQILLNDDVVFVSAAKLKTHHNTHATLTMKNMVGLPPVQLYHEDGDEWRFVMHQRGIEQVIVDINRVRPIDYGVVDGVLAMEGDGPVGGTPVELGLVVAGQNAVAVDRACLWATSLPQRGPKHLDYAARVEMGPAEIGDIDLLGDPFEPVAFAWPSTLVPLLEYPKVFPPRFVPGNGEETTAVYHILPSCLTRVEVVKVSELWPETTVIRTLQELESRPAGVQIVTWDGRDDGGAVVAPGRYSVRVFATHEEGSAEAYASGWVRVVINRQ